MTNYHANKNWISDECFRRSVKFYSRMGVESKRAVGKIWDEQGVVCQQYCERNSSVSKPKPFSGLEFVISNASTSEELVFRKVSYPRSVFEIFKGAAAIGTVRKRGIFRNRYTIDLGGLVHWKFCIPLFSTRFRGESEDKGSFWVSVGPSKAEWSILIEPNSSNHILIAVLAFIHNEYWNHG